MEAPLRLVWEYNASAGFGPGGPLIAGAYVLVATRKGEVHAIEASRGKKRGVEGFGEAIDGTPALAEGVLYVPVAWGRKTGVVAHDLSSGSRLWLYRSAPVSTSVLVVGGRVFFVDEDSIVHALALNGETIWTLNLDDHARVTSSPVLVGEKILAVADDLGVVYGINLEEGRILWRKDLGEPVYASMASGSGALFVPTSRASLFALDGRSGAYVWHFRGGGASVKFSTPAISREYVVFGGSNGKLVALSVRNGTALWEWQGKGAISAAPAISGTNVYIGTMDGSAHALDLVTGEELWRSEVKGRIKSAPAVGVDAVYFVGEPRYLYRFSSQVEVTGEG